MSLSTHRVPTSDGQFFEPGNGEKVALLTEHTRHEIDEWIARFPAGRQRSATLSALRFAQEQNNGFLTPEIMDAVAEYLRLPSIQVYEVATFYNMYDVKPAGRYKVTVCTNLPCALSGGVDAAEYLKAKLGIGFNQTTADGAITLKEGECMGACGDAPVLLLNNKRMCSRMAPEKIDALIAEVGHHAVDLRLLALEFEGDETTLVRNGRAADVHHHLEGPVDPVEERFPDLGLVEVEMDVLLGLHRGSRRGT